MVGSLGEREHRLQLRFAPHLQSYTMRLAESDDLLHHVSLLIYFDGVHGGVSARVAELPDRVVKAFGKHLDPRAQDVRKAQQERKLHSLRVEIHRQLKKVKAPAGLTGRMHGHMTPRIDPEVADAPPRHVVQVEGILGRPPCLGGRVDVRRFSGNGANGALLLRKCPRQLVWSGADLYFQPP